MVRKLFGLVSPRGDFELKTTLHGWGGVLQLMVDNQIAPSLRYFFFVVRILDRSVLQIFSLWFRVYLIVPSLRYFLYVACLLDSSVPQIFSLWFRVQQIAPSLRYFFSVPCILDSSVPYIFSLWFRLYQIASTPRGITLSEFVYIRQFRP